MRCKSRDHPHRSFILGFGEDSVRGRFYAESALDLSTLLAPHVAAIRAYGVTDALTCVQDSQILPHYET